MHHRIELLKNHAEKFKNINRKIKSMYDVSNISEEMARHFDFLKEEIKIINDN